MKKFFAPAHYGVTVDTVLLIVRVVTGIAFILHGWGKIQTPFSWMPGGSVPGVFQALAAVAEFGGGIALILGLVTRLASLGLFITMIVAALFHAVVRGDPFVSKGGPSYEPATVYILISLILLVMGPGRFSLDRLIFGSKSSK